MLYKNWFTVDENWHVDHKNFPYSIIKYTKTSTGWMPNGPVLKCHLKTGQPYHLNTEQMEAILFSYVLVRYSNGRSCTEDIAHRLNIWIPNHLKSELPKVQYSNGLHRQMVDIKILRYLSYRGDPHNGGLHYRTIQITI